MHVSGRVMSGGGGAAGSESGVVGDGENGSARRRATGVGDAPWWPAELRHYCR
jgi:hypothetical protein